MSQLGPKLKYSGGNMQRRSTSQTTSCFTWVSVWFKTTCMGFALALLMTGCGGGGGGSSSGGSSGGSTGGSGGTTVTPVSLPDATRLVDQATLGASDAAIASVQAVGITPWVDAQLATPSTGYIALPYISPNSNIGCPSGSAPTCFRDNYTAFPIQLQFYKNALTGADQLRQRVALAWSQIFVISGIDIQSSYGLREYHQMLLDNAFTNYRTLLQKVTLSPAMGDYLDMVNNNKPVGTVTPNENYGREVLQLFSIGLYKLNPDGTQILDGSGQPIPTYDQETVEGFAYAFTGWTYPPTTGVTSAWTNPRNYLGDMVPFDTHHDKTAKQLLNGVTLPAGQDINQDLAGALDNIFNNPNVGPFIGKQLIQFLVTSNPTPAYVARVTAVFNDNGSGVRGDMKAVVRAILLDPEARGDVKTDPNYGKLRDPVLYVTGVLRALGGTSDGVYANQQSSNLGESVFQAPSVFNFFPPDNLLPNSTSLLGPQFDVQNTTTTVNRFNYIYALTYANNGNGVGADSSVSGSTGTKLDLTSLQTLAGTPSALVDKLDALLTHTTLTTTEKNNIITAINAVSATDPVGRTRMAVYLVISSPRYQITR